MTTLLKLTMGKSKDKTRSHKFDLLNLLRPVRVGKTIMENTNKCHCINLDLATFDLWVSLI